MNNRTFTYFDLQTSEFSPVDITKYRYYWEKQNNLIIHTYDHNTETLLGELQVSTFVFIKYYDGLLICTQSKHPYIPIHKRFNNFDELKEFLILSNIK